MTPNEAHEFNIDVAQREIDGRAALGEDMTGATICKRTYAIVKSKPARILSQEQADAVYSAIVALNNVAANIDKITLPDAYYGIEVVSYGDRITIRYGRKGLETYDNQAAFATAYGLQQG